MPPSLFCPNPLGPNFKEQTVHWLIWGNVLCFQYGVFPLRDVVRLLNKNGEPILKLCTFLTIFVLGFFGPLWTDSLLHVFFLRFFNEVKQADFLLQSNPAFLGYTSPAEGALLIQHTRRLTYKCLIPCSPSLHQWTAFFALSLSVKVIWAHGAYWTTLCPFLCFTVYDMGIIYVPLLFEMIPLEPPRLGTYLGITRSWCFQMLMLLVYLEFHCFWNRCFNSYSPLKSPIL